MSSDHPPNMEDHLYRSLQFALMNPTVVRAAYFGAHRRAQRLREELRELEIQMLQAEREVGELLLPSWPPLRAPVRPPTLHEAIRLVLEARANGWTRTGQLARAIAKRCLYRRRDGLPASTKDISARVSSHPELFERQGAVVRLRNPEPREVKIPGVLVGESSAPSPEPAPSARP